LLHNYYPKLREEMQTNLLIEIIDIILLLLCGNVVILLIAIMMMLDVFNNE